MVTELYHYSTYYSKKKFPQTVTSKFSISIIIDIVLFLPKLLKLFTQKRYQGLSS